MKAISVLKTVSMFTLALAGASTYASELSPSLSSLTDTSMNEIIGGTLVAASDPVASSTVMIYGQENGGGFICSGSIIAKDLILTAAHCLGEDGKAQLVVIFDTNINGKGPVIPVAKQTRPADYVMKANSSPVDHDDLGLLLLSAPLPAGFRPAKLLGNPLSIVKGASVELAGYGIDVPTEPTDPKDDAGAGILRKVGQSLLSASYGKTEVLVNIQGKGSCHGDSGGPAFMQSGGQLYLFGVASRMTQDDLVANNHNEQDYSCNADMVYTNILNQKTWINSAAALLHKK